MAGLVTDRPFEIVSRWEMCVQHKLQMISSDRLTTMRCTKLDFHIVTCPFVDLMNMLVIFLDGQIILFYYQFVGLIKKDE